MLRFLIYLFPALFDVVLTCMLLTGSMRMAASGASATATTAVTATWAGTYAIACLIIGRLIKPGNAIWFIVASGGVAAAAMASFIVFPSLSMVYYFTGVVSVAGAMFFVPFQVFMKAVDQEHASPSVARATALYTLSWSSGCAVGPFLAGLLQSLTGDWRYGYLCSGVCAIVVSLGVLLLRMYMKKRSARQSAAAAPVETPAPTPHEKTYENLPDFAWLGWVGSGVGILCFYTILGLFPVTGKHLNLPKDQQGLILALMLVTQALTGLMLGFGRFWMYRRTPIAFFGLCGIAGMILYGLSHTFAVFCLAAVCFGLYSGTFFFYFVFHAIVHPNRSARYVSINEALVGVFGFAGPMVGGILADQFHYNTPYLTAVGIIVAGVLLKLVVHSRFRSRLPDSQPLMK